jgi:hypothetical protein
MNAKDAIRYALTSTRDMLGMYLADLSDADLLVRAAPDANHIAWQLGHLILAEGYLMGKEFPKSGSYPELPAGFAAQHDKAKAKEEPPKGFLSKQEYLDLFNRARGVTLSLLESASEADLDRPTAGPLAKLAPTVGTMFLMTANHVMMHAGQFTVVRRKLGKPVLF